MQPEPLGGVQCSARIAVVSPLSHVRLHPRPQQTRTKAMNRRESLKLLAGAAVFAATPLTAWTALAQQAPAGPFQLPPLGYGFDALEPHIDAQTMMIHHDKHH